MHDEGAEEEMKFHAILDRIISEVEFYSNGLVRETSIFLSDTMIYSSCFCSVVFTDGGNHQLMRY
jgi:hypothetical protein